MIPKEKAAELFEKFAMYLRANLMYDEEAKEDAKQCALIAVEEIMGTIDAEHHVILYNYWQKVKLEIEKL